MTSATNPIRSVSENVLASLNTVEPYLQAALSTCSSSGLPVSLFPAAPSTTSSFNSPPPTLHPNTRNELLLFPGSFNPPHKGHLATIRYFSERRKQLGIAAMFIFADPSNIINTKEKKWGNIVLPQELRNAMIAFVPEISQLIAEKWLFIIVGDMESHIQLLRMTTNLISEAGWGVKLIGFLGGDKLTVESQPHLPPADLTAWGPVDEFLIINARRPVDFYTPGPENVGTSPHKLPGCTEWEQSNDSGRDANAAVGKLWICKALTVPGEPIIKFRASESSASNGISSTKIRRIMSEVHNEELLDELKDQVLCARFMVE